MFQIQSSAAKGATKVPAGERVRHGLMANETEARLFLLGVDP
jgi:hypothetical protein